MKIILKESYLMNITYLQVTGRPSCGQEIIAIGAVDAIDVKHWGCEPQSWESITYFSICQKFRNSLRFSITAYRLWHNALFALVYFVFSKYFFKVVCT